MRQRRAALVMALAFCSAVSIGGVASAQIPLPAAKPADGAALFKQQCALCHTTNASDPPRQGPTLFNIVGREAGTPEGFRYSAGFTNAKFKLDEQKLDERLVNPEMSITFAFIPCPSVR